MMSYNHQHIHAGCDLWMSCTPHEDIVTIMGFALVQGWQGYHPLLLDAWADLLDKGTTKHDKIAIATAIESLGAHVNFSHANGYLMWSAQCLKTDAEVIYNWVKEIIFNASFPEEEIRLWIKLTLSALHEEMSEPMVQSLIQWSQHIYPSHHPSYKNNSIDDILWLESLDGVQTQAILQSITCDSMQIVVVGDVDTKEHAKALTSWDIGKSMYDTQNVPDIIPSTSQRKHVEIKDKTSSYVRIGQALTITKEDPDYWPLIVAVDALGGTFSARLMRTVRDIEGLTYGVNSHVVGLVNRLGGYFSVVITLAPMNVEKGIASTLFQIKKWHDEGLTEEELNARKEGLLGRHAVRATSTTQIATSMRYGLMHDFGASYSTLYMQAIESVTLSQVNAAIKKWIHPEAFIIVSAGTTQDVKIV